MRFIFGVILSAGLLPLVGGSASACINDRELVTHEKEFKSSYLEQPEQTWQSSDPGFALPAAGSGLLMLLGGVAIGVVRGTARQRSTSLQDRLDKDRP